MCECSNKMKWISFYSYLPEGKKNRYKIYYISFIIVLCFLHNLDILSKCHRKYTTDI